MLLAGPTLGSNPWCDSGSIRVRFGEDWRTSWPMTRPTTRDLLARNQPPQCGPRGVREPGSVRGIFAEQNPNIKGNRRSGEFVARLVIEKVYRMKLRRNSKIQPDLFALLAVSVWLSACGWIGAARAGEPVEDFLNFRRTGSASAQLETSVTRFRHPQSQQLVSLVAAVHIAEAGYYQQIQEQLDRHDLVLYEMVGGPAPGSPEAAAELQPHDRDDEGSRLQFISTLQKGMQDLLQLEHQMDQIDYTRGNLRHADLTSRAFSLALQVHGLFDIDPNALMKGLAPAMLDGFGLQAALSTQDDQTVNRVRWVMAQTLSKSANQMAMLGVSDIEKPEDLILGIRNDQLWKVLQRSVPERWRRIAIFYGAAHLPDIRRRLLEQGWVQIEAVWIPAWKIPAGDPIPFIDIERRARL